MRAYLSFLRSNAPWLGAGFLLIFMSGIAQTSFVAIFAGVIRAEFGLSHGQWGGLYSLATALSAVLMLIFGGVADRFGARWLGMAVLLGLAAGCLFLSLSQGLIALAGSLFVIRFLGLGMASHVALVATGRWFSRTRGKAVAVVLSGFAVSEAVLPVLFVAALETTDWRRLWQIVALLILAGAILLPLVLRGERIPAGDEVSGEQTGMGGLHWTRGAALRHWLFWLIAPSVLVMPMAISTFFFQQVHYAGLAGVEHIALVALFPPFTVALSLWSFFWGWAVDRWGTATIFPFSLLPAALGFGVFASLSGLPAIAFGMLCVAVSFAAQDTLRTAFWPEYYGTRHLGSIKSVAMAVIVMGTALGPGISGVLIDLGISLRVQFAVLVVLFLAASVGIRIGLTRARPLLAVPA